MTIHVKSTTRISLNGVFILYATHLLFHPDKDEDSVFTCSLKREQELRECPSHKN